MTQKVSAYMGGLGLDAINKLEVEANATVTVGNGTSTGNVIVGGDVVVQTNLTVGGTFDLGSL
mgnify:CR=1 FL=1|jgi:hypothetical protein